MAELTKRVIDFLSSPRLAVVLIAMLLAQVLVGMLVPQVDYLGPDLAAQWRADQPVLSGLAATLQVDHIYSTWYFLATIGFLALVCLVCTSRRLWRREWHRASRSVEGGADRVVRPQTWLASGLEPDAAVRVSEDALRRARLKVARDDPGEGVRTVSAAGGFWGFWGSIVFHVALLLICAGAAWGALTGFQGQIVMTEGQTVTISPEAFLRIDHEPQVGGLPAGFDVALDGLEFQYDRDAVTDAIAQMRVIPEDGPAIAREVRVNYPLEHEGFSMLIDDAGYAARLAVSRDGRLVDDAFIALNERVPSGFADVYGLPDGDELRVVVVPDRLLASSDVASEPLRFVDPAAYVAPNAPDEPLVGPLRVGEATRVAGVDVTLKEVRFWSSFMARARGGRPLLYFGLWLAVLGVAVRFLDPDRRIAVWVRERAGAGSEIAVRVRGRYGRLGTVTVTRRLREALGLELEERTPDR